MPANHSLVNDTVASLVAPRKRAQTSPLPGTLTPWRLYAKSCRHRSNTTRQTYTSSLWNPSPAIAWTRPSQWSSSYNVFPQSTTETPLHPQRLHGNKGSADVCSVTLHWCRALIQSTATEHATDNCCRAITSFHRALLQSVL